MCIMYIFTGSAYQRRFSSICGSSFLRYKKSTLDAALVYAAAIFV